ncbi:MFS transporter [Pseudonocardia sp. KRD291]|uniref:MFS transporter n=1 Tax=Pseudonocardia sp. KRD291 TaxID=2792007 RepID=UPI001C4A07A1|nr:MFS transporter [Pseudonocardia sp. KRD291]MBW0105091.1 MFS transporter [Pseudonocardia sp. KRD291]
MPVSASARRSGALGLCCAANGLLFLDVSTVNVALPSFQRGLGAGPEDLSWILAGYILTFGLFLVPGGRLGDVLGRRAVFLAGAALFALFSIAAGLATTPQWLIAGRLLQGAAGGLLAPQLVGLIQQMFDGRERARAFGVYGAVTAAATALGPVLGGVLIDLGGPDDGWRWAFFVNVPVVAVMLAAAPALLPRRGPERTRRSLDVVGSLLLGTAVFAVLFPLVEAGDGAPRWSAGAGVVVLGLFVAWERRYRARGREPLLGREVLTSPGYRPGVVIGSAYLAGSTGIFLVLTVYAQQGLGYTALAAGLASVPYALGSVAGALAGGRLVGRDTRAVATGSAAMIVGLAGTALVVWRAGGPLTGVWTALPLLVAGLGSGLVITANQALTLAHVPPAHGGTAAGLQQTAQRIGSAVGVVTTSAVFFGRLDAPGPGPGHGHGYGYGTAAATGLLAAAAFVVVALGVALLGPARRLAEQ